MTDEKLVKAAQKVLAAKFDLDAAAKSLEQAKAYLEQCSSRHYDAGTEFIAAVKDRGHDGSLVIEVDPAGKVGYLIEYQADGSHQLRPVALVKRGSKP